MLEVSTGTDPLCSGLAQDVSCDICLKQALKDYINTKYKIELLNKLSIRRSLYSNSWQIVNSSVESSR